MSEFSYQIKDTDEHGDVDVVAFKQNGEWVVVARDEDNHVVEETKFSRKPTRSSINDVFMLE